MVSVPAVNPPVGLVRNPTVYVAPDPEENGEAETVTLVIGPTPAANAAGATPTIEPNAIAATPTAIFRRQSLAMVNPLVCLTAKN
jgi:hypothetical protein